MEGTEIPPGDVPPSIQLRIVLPGYFPTMGIPLLSGRYLDDSDLNGAVEAVVVNEVMAESYWPGEDPIGKHLRIMNPDRLSFTVVGVVGNTKAVVLDTRPAPRMYRTLDQFVYEMFPYATQQLVVRSEVDPLSLVSAVTEKIWSVDK